MAKRIYFCSLLGTGTDADAYRSWFQANNIAMTQLDMRPYTVIEDGYIVAWGEISDANHVLAVADPSVTYLPFEDAGGNVLPFTATLSDIPAAKRKIITNAFTARGIPTTGITLSWTIGQALRLLRRRMHLGLLLSNLDFDAPDALLNTMPPLLLKAIKRWLQNHGFDVSGLVGTMTEAQAIDYLAAQPVMDTYVDSHPGLVI